MNGSGVKVPPAARAPAPSPSRLHPTRLGVAFLGLILVTIPTYTKGRLPLVAKNRAGQRLGSQVEALEDPRRGTPDLLAPTGSIDRTSLDTATRQGAVQEIKEWQAIMDHLRRLPVARPGELPVVPVDARAAEGRAIRAA